MAHRRLHALLAASLATLVCAAGAASRTPAIRHGHAVRTPAVAGLQSGQWKAWWGFQDYSGPGVTLSSIAPTSPAETHSSLITTKQTWQDATISFQTTTLQQLRVGSAPNPWEVGWVMFRFKDLANYYWFMLKTNGFELGKKQGSDTQIFLDTGDLPAIAVGQTRAVRVVAKGAHIQVFVDGAKVVDYLDPHPLLGNGAVGLYEEDSQALFNSFSVS